MARRRIPPYAVRKFLDDVRVGNHERAAARADELAVWCSGHAVTRPQTPAVVLAHGEILLRNEDLLRAVSYLEQGLSMLDETGPHEIIGNGDHHRVLLVSTLLQLGRYQEAAHYLTPMEDPSGPLDTRLAALRCRAQLAAIYGNPEGAHQFLNTAATVAERVRGMQAPAMVDADRACLLATQGRLFEAMAIADRLFARTLRGGHGDRARWAAASTAAVAFTLSRHAVDQGRGYDAERFLVAGIAAVEQAPSAYGVAHMDLAMARAWRHRGDFVNAELALRKAAVAFSRLGCRPAAALVSLEDACLNEARGTASATVNLFERALREFEEIGHAWEVVALQRHLGRYDELAQTSAAVDAGPSPTDMRASRLARMLG